MSKVMGMAPWVCMEHIPLFGVVAGTLWTIKCHKQGAVGSVCLCSEVKRAAAAKVTQDLQGNYLNCTHSICSQGKNQNIHLNQMLMVLIFIISDHLCHVLLPSAKFPLGPLFPTDLKFLSRSRSYPWNRCPNPSFITTSAGLNK